MSDIRVNDIGSDNKIDADGLAVGQLSKFATVINDELANGVFKVFDDTLYKLLSLMVDSENIYLEPSVTAGLIGPVKVLQIDYIKKYGIQSENITHLAWATGVRSFHRQKKNIYMKREVFMEKIKFY